MNFKFFRGQNFVVDEPRLQFFQPRRYNNVEFCFQFDDNEPVSFATSENELHIIITNGNDSNITFNDNNRVFKIFSRENLGNRS